MQGGCQTAREQWLAALRREGPVRLSVLTTGLAPALRQLVTTEDSPSGNRPAFGYLTTRISRVPAGTSNVSSRAAGSKRERAGAASTVTSDGAFASACTTTWKTDAPA